MTVEAPDIVVPVRELDPNEPLRYALRSWAAHLPHRRVWVVGHRPAWLTGVEHIPTVQAGTKFQNTTAAVRAACENDAVSDHFLLANDDMFVMAPQLEMPMLHRGLVRDVEAYTASIANSAYLRGMRETRALLAELGEPEPLSYELHVPMPVDKLAMMAALDYGAHLDVLHKRTLCGNLAGLGGRQIEDVKVSFRGPAFPRDSPFLSTMPDSFTNGMVGHFIRQAFPEPGPYERRGR